MSGSQLLQASGDLNAKAGANEASKEENKEVKREPQRILHYAQVYDLRTYTNKLVKIGKEKRLDRKKPVLVERRCINHKGQHTHTEVDIKSQALRAILIEINQHVEGLSLKKEPPIADPKLFFHSRVALQERLCQEEQQNPQDSSLVADLKVALQYVEEEHGSNLATLERLLPSNEITWGLIWALFAPNMMMYHFHEFTEQAQILLVRNLKKSFKSDGTPYWHVDCDMIADDGLRFGFTKNLGLASRPEKEYDLIIDFYEGVRKIQDLTVYPLQYAEDDTAIRSNLLHRGKRYVEMTGHTYQETSGPAMRENMNSNFETKRLKFTTHGRVMVDASAFRSFNQNCKYIPSVHSTLDRNTLTDEQLMLCSPVALGFSFGDKVWGGFAVSRLQNIVWKDEAFRSLVMREKQKTLIRSLVKQHSSKETGYDDVVQGKGKGLIGLLSGRPGCGKTLTAEAVAEVTTRPLYMMSAGELGTEPDKVDKQLTLVLELSHRWDAVLLLDESDVFLQERDSKDVARNALVSIFLRQLEYFQGILILTTNRIEECDPAFESRIHFSIHYPDLDHEARKQIWETFIQKAQLGADLTVSIKDDVERLASHKMNGRQIKNTVSSARSIARENQCPFDVGHIDTVLEVMEAWNTAKSKKLL